MLSPQHYLRCKQYPCCGSKINSTSSIILSCSYVWLELSETKPKGLECQLSSLGIATWHPENAVSGLCDTDSSSFTSVHASSVHRHSCTGEWRLLTPCSISLLLDETRINIAANKFHSAILMLYSKLALEIIIIIFQFKSPGLIF